MINSMIESSPNILMGKPCIVGTRISVELVLDKLAAGESIEQLLESHPNLSREGVLAALEFASQAIKADVVYPVNGKSE